MEQLKKFTHFIFDLDGTLIDTERSVLTTWQATLKEFVPGRDFSMEELHVVLGITTEEALRKLDVDVGDDFEKRWTTHYQKEAHSISFFEGAEDMLKRLKQNGAALGIVSSRSRQEYDDYFKSFGLDRLCGAVVLKEDTQKHKPDAAPIAKYLALTGAGADACIYIGDMPTDVECAKNAGVSSGLAVWSSSDAKKDCPADFVFESPSDLLSLLR